MEIVIDNIRYISDRDASKEIQSMIVAKIGKVDIAEIAEITRLPSVQIERIVDAWS